MKKKAIVIGSGIGGLAVAIRLAKQNFDVHVYEKNAYPGGKLCEMQLGKYRFDKGPSLFTMPQLIDELSDLSSYKKLAYKKLETITHYFYEDGTTLTAQADVNEFAKELNTKLGEDIEQVKKHLKRSDFFYNTTAPLFLEQSLHITKNHFTLKTLKGVIRSPRLQLFKTMDAANRKAFKNEKTVQLFNRYATYNGSNPYKAPALLNIIPHLEFNIGAYFPIGGMNKITEYLVNYAKNLGVNFHLNEEVKEIIISNNEIKGIKTKDNTIPSDIIVSDVDIHVLYNKLITNSTKPSKILAQEKSSSAYIFYWGVKKEFKELGLHNILFSDNYKKEFDCLFETSTPYEDPTLYINITSKECETDAPNGCENWFILVNVPHNKTQQQVGYGKELRQNVINKINRILKTNIENYIEEESTLSPYDIEQQTSSFGGSLYGNSSNNKFAAFMRHSNYSSKIKNLYFVGGSVHPGGGIPLCLLSGKIVADMIKNKN